MTNEAMMRTDGETKCCVPSRRMTCGPVHTGSGFSGSIKVCVELP